MNFPWLKTQDTYTLSLILHFVLSFLHIWFLSFVPCLLCLVCLPSSPLDFSVFSIFFGLVLGNASIYI